MITRTLILALSLTTAAVPAAAAETESTTATVRVDDLDLTKAGDRDRLDRRINNAARRACRPDRRGAAESARQTACIATALADAERQAGRAIARAQGGTQLALLMGETAR